MRRWAVTLLLVGCHASEESAPPPPGCVWPDRIREGRCLGPGVQDDGCPAGTTGQSDGSCMAAGIGPGLCGEGFAHDGDVGCVALLPAGACPRGLMAVPGDARCRSVMECGSGRWGSLPTDATTEHVDIGYIGGDSDGSAQKPWTSIAEAVNAAAPGALVAIAAGSYAEDVLLEGKPVRVWGVCPTEVAIVGTGVGLGAIDVRTGASGSEVGGVAISGARFGVSLRGSDVLLDRVWIHDNPTQGIHVESTRAPTTLRVTNALIEGNHEVGIVLLGSDATIERSVLRGTLPGAGGYFGEGIIVASHVGSLAPSNAVVRGSVIEDNHTIGVHLLGSTLQLETSVVRRTQAQTVDGLYGDGILIEPDDAQASSSLTLRGSLVDANRRAGVLALDSRLDVETTVVRDTLPEEATQLFGRGINAFTTQGARVTSSLIAHNHDMGMQLLGSSLLVEATVVRDNVPRPDGKYGWGVSIRNAFDAPSSAVVVGSVFERHREVGIGTGSAEVTLAGVVVRGVDANPQGGFGDALSSWSDLSETKVSVTASLFEETARAGISNFGALVSLGSTALRCHSFEIEGEHYTGYRFTFDDLGHNACGCPTPNSECVAVTAGLEPPEPVDTID